MRAVGVIPVRSGSKSIPNKNIVEVAGKPLMAYVLEQLAQCETLDSVYMTTDSEKYFEIGRTHLPGLRFIRRPARLAEDVPTEDVLLDALEQMEPKPDVLVCVQVTTPLTLASDIDSCVKALQANQEFNSAITFCEVTEKPEWMFSILAAGEKPVGVKPLLMTNLAGEWGVRQSLGRYYRPNGAAYAVRTKGLELLHSIFASPIYPVVMPRERSLDVDEPFDLALIRAYVLFELARRES